MNDLPPEIIIQIASVAPPIARRLVRIDRRCAALLTPWLLERATIFATSTARRRDEDDTQIYQLGCRLSGDVPHGWQHEIYYDDGRVLQMSRRLYHFGDLRRSDVWMKTHRKHHFEHCESSYRDGHENGLRYTTEYYYRRLNRMKITRYVDSKIRFRRHIDIADLPGRAYDFHTVYIYEDWAPIVARIAALLNVELVIHDYDTDSDSDDE